MACRPGIVKAIEEFKLSVYGENYDEESESVGNEKVSEASKKRKAIAENAAKESANYDWADLADNGKVRINVALFCFNHHGFSFEFSCACFAKLRLEQAVLN